jgi:hypothetical protein
MALGISLAVGRLTLNQVTLVRIQDPQPDTDHVWRPQISHLGPFDSHFDSHASQQSVLLSQRGINLSRRVSLEYWQNMRVNVSGSCELAMAPGFGRAHRSKG